jgi:hypothetical protein
MKETPNGKRWSLRAIVHVVFGRDLPLERETTLYILVSALDAFMTYVVLRYSSEGKTGAFLIESNPLARFFFDHWGVKGLVWFKFALVGFVAVVAQIIATKRERTARWLLNVGTLVVVAVVVYSFYLLVTHLE